MRLEDEIKTNRFSDEIQKAHLNILFTSSWVLTRITNSLKPFDLTNSQYNVLRIVRGQRGVPIRSTDILARVIDPHSNVTRIIDRLEEKGLLRRLDSGSDRRSRPVVLTHAGEQLLQKIDDCWTADTPHTSQISQEEAATLNRLLDRLREV